MKEGESEKEERGEGSQGKRRESAVDWGDCLSL